MFYTVTLCTFRLPRDKRISCLAFTCKLGIGVGVEWGGGGERNGVQRLFSHVRTVPKEFERCRCLRKAVDTIPVRFPPPYIFPVAPFTPVRLSSEGCPLSRYVGRRRGWLRIRDCCTHLLSFVFSKSDQVRMLYPQPTSFATTTTFPPVPLLLPPN